MAPLGALRAAPAGRIAIAGFAVARRSAAVPAFRLRLGSADASNDPTSSTTHQAYDLIAKGFGPGANGPILVVADTSAARIAAAACRSLVDALRVDARRRVGHATRSPTQRAPPRSRRCSRRPAPQAEATKHLVHHLRDDVVPERDRGHRARREPRRADREPASTSPT